MPEDADSASQQDFASSADPEESESGPLRRCIVTRERLPKERMIRFVVGPDRQLVPDLAAKLPGRGIWLTASADVIGPAGVTDGEISDQSNGRQPTGPQGEGRGGFARREDIASGDLEQSASAPHISGKSSRSGMRRPRTEHGGAGLVDRQLARAFARAARGPVLVPPDLPLLLQTALVRRITELLGLARRAGQAVAGFEKGREYLRTTPSRLVLQASDGSVSERARFLTGAAPDLTVFDPLPGVALGRVFGRDYVVHVAVAPGKLADLIAVEAGRLAGLRSGSARTTGRDPVPVNTVLDANG